MCCFFAKALANLVNSCIIGTVPKENYSCQNLKISISALIPPAYWL